VDFPVLEIFRAVAAEQSVTRAARRLDRVQSNVTTRIKLLEEELGVLLFHRDAKRMTLTAEGQRFLTYAEKLLGLAEEARQSMHAGKVSGSLRVGSMESTAASRLPKVLARYHGRWPDVNLQMSTGTAQQLTAAVIAHQLDCALVAHPEPLEPGLQGTRVFSEELMLVLPAQHPPVQGPDDVRIRTLASFMRGCAYRRIAENWLGGQDLKVIEVGSYHAVLACVAAGSCIGIVPQSVLDLQRDALNVRTHKLMTVDTLLICRSTYSVSAFEEFLRALQDESAPS
jgi:DNA-binding transcriptional LysR family regulator